MCKGLFKGGLLLSLGIVIILITIIFKENSMLNSFGSGVFTGTGLGLIAIAVINLVKNILLQKYPAEMKRQEILSNEERQVMIREKAGSKAYSVSNIAFAIIILTLAVSDVDMKSILIVWGGMICSLVAYIFMLFYGNKKY